MKKLNSDAKGFIDGIVDHLKKNDRGDRGIPKVQKFLRKVSSRSLREHTAKVYTSVALKQPEREKIVRILSQKMHYPVSLECITKPSIIAGLRIEIGDLVFDLSYEEKLENIKTMLLKGSSI